MRKCFAFLLVLSIPILKCFSQVPTTDIYLLDVKAKHGKFIFSNPQKISDWKGYNNQPYFTPDGKSIYYVSYRNKQSDIYRYDIDLKTTTQFTNTPEDEYSPKLTPDGKYISVVRVMKDSSQQLWEFPLDSGAPKHLLIGEDSIGYYCWTNSGIFTANVPEPMNIKKFDTSLIFNKTISNLKKTNQSTLYERNAGRTLLDVKYKNFEEFFYVEKPVAKKDSIYSIHVFQRGEIKTVPIYINTLPNCEDFAIGPKNTLFMGKNGKLYKCRIGVYMGKKGPINKFGQDISLDKIGQDKEWIEIADFSNTDYKNFYRIVFNKKGDKIALVSYQGKKP